MDTHLKDLETDFITPTVPPVGIPVVDEASTDTTKQQDSIPSSVKVYLIGKKEIYGYIPAIYPYIKQVLDKSEESKAFDVGDIIELAMKGQAHIWVFMDDAVRAVAVTQITQKAKHRTFVWWLYSGENYFIPKYVDAMAAWAKERFDCKYIETFARPGLAKQLDETLGFKRREIRCTREIL